jgi:hypothetical protein
MTRATDVENLETVVKCTTVARVKQGEVKSQGRRCPRRWYGQSPPTTPAPHVSGLSNSFTRAYARHLYT